MEVLNKLAKEGLILVEDNIRKYRQAYDNFYFVWSGLSTKSPKIDKMGEYKYYGYSSFGYTPSLETESEKLLENCFRLYYLDKTYPHDAASVFILPRHKSVTQETKNNMFQWRQEILNALTSIREHLDSKKIQILINFVKKLKERK